MVAIIVRALTPYVGATMANASTLGMAHKHGLAAEVASRQDVQPVVDALGPGLSVFIGRDKARAALEQIWRDVDALLGRA